MSTFVDGGENKKIRTHETRARINLFSMSYFPNYFRP